MIMFIPGETIVHKFYIPFVRNDIKRIIVSYREKNHIILEKYVYDNQVTNESQGASASFVVTLSQQESLLFSDDYSFKVQLNVFLKDNTTRCASLEMDGATGLQHIREVVN